MSLEPFVDDLARTLAEPMLRRRRALRVIGVTIVAGTDGRIASAVGGAVPAMLELLGADALPGRSS